LSPGRALSAFALALLAAAGCTRLLGLDYTYEPQGTGGAHGAGGAVGPGGPGGGAPATTTATATATGTSSSGSGGGCGAFVWDTQASCQTCMQAECCSELEACDTGTPCAEIAACKAMCQPGDDGCLGACIQADASMHQGDGLTAYANLYGCFGSTCEQGMDCFRAICDSGYDWTDPSCANCLGSDPTCCGAFSACLNDATCTACLSSPTDSGCSTNSLYTPINTCEFTTCGELCSWGLCGTTFGYYEAECNYCLNQASTGCCPQITACIMDTTSTCYQCFAGTTVTGCDADANFNALNTCISMNCEVPCAGL
jgi:hypothetical protein